jgi:hypothetical protein
MPRNNKPADGAAEPPRRSRAPRKGNGGTEPFNDPDAVARRAYEIYMQRGGQDGADLDDWLEAERQLRPGPSDVTGPAPARTRRRKADGAEIN